MKFLNKNVEAIIANIDEIQGGYLLNLRIKDEIVSVVCRLDIELKKGEVVSVKFGPKMSNYKYNILELQKKQNKEYLVKSNIWNKNEQNIKDAVKIINSAIKYKKNILIRHHNDVDGYCSGLALEKGILPQIINPRNFRRLPSLTPFYNFSDCIRDINSFSRNTLLILADLGDIEQSEQSLVLAKNHGFEILYIDHHPLTYKSEKIDVLLNANDEAVVAGMVCSEVANKLGATDLNIFPALAGIGDRCESDEFKEYLKNSGKTIEELKKIALSLDYMAYEIRHNEYRDFTSTLISDWQQGYDIANKNLIKAKVSVKKYTKHQKIGVHDVLTIDIDSVSKKGEYPNSSKYARIAFDNHVGTCVVLGILPNTIIMRSSVESIDLSGFIEKAKQRYPESLIDGGGHKQAASIKFIPAAKDEVYKFILNQIRNSK